MRVTVDASIVVKWFVSEPMCDEARLLLARRIHMHAPDFMLVEFANTIWKKARKKEIPDARQYLEELAALPGIVALQPSGALVERAARIALELDHPIYDCLYLACAEATDSAVITADRRFADKALGRPLGIPVHHIAAPDVASRIETAATAPVIGEDTVKALIAAYEFFAETERSVLDAHFSGHEGLRIVDHDVRELFLNSPSYRRLVDSIRALSDEDRIDLNAIGWLGAGRFPDWQQSFAHAEEMVASLGPEHLGPEYTAGYGHCWRTGYERAIGT